MSDRSRPVLEIIGIFFLCFGVYLVITDFTTVEKYIKLEPGFLIPDNCQTGLMGAGVIFLGLAIYAWLYRDMFPLKSKDGKEAMRPYSRAYRFRKRANEAGVFLLAILVIVVIAILYYALR